MSSSFADMESDDRHTVEGDNNIPPNNSEKETTAAHELKQTYSLIGEWISSFGTGVIGDISRRKEYLISDWSDGVNSKLLSAATFIYFACLLPSISFGILNQSHTNGFFTVKKTIMSQAFGGIIFSVFSTQPLVILLSTAPLAIFIKLIYDISASEDLPFSAMYAWVGIFNSIFIILFSVVNLPKIFIQYSSPFLCETFGVFIMISLTYDSIRPLVLQFDSDYKDNTRDVPLLWLILEYGTVYIGMYLLNFRSTKLFNPAICEIIGDFSLPLAVIVMSFFGTYVFGAVELQGFDGSEGVQLLFPNLVISGKGIGISLGIGFGLAILMFMDTNISSAVVSTSSFRLKKGVYYHWDNVLVALINFVLSVLGLPWLNGALPQSPMYALACAQLDGTSDRNVVVAVESRLAAFIAHGAIAISYLMLPKPLEFIPDAVLYGLFLYMAFTSLTGNSFWERFLMLFKDTSSENSVNRIKIKETNEFNETEKKNVIIVENEDKKIKIELDSEIENEKKKNNYEEKEENGKIEQKEEIEKEENNDNKQENVDNFFDQKDQENNSNKIDVIPSLLTQSIINKYTYIQLLALVILCLCGLYPYPYINVVFPIILALLIPVRQHLLVPLFKGNLDSLDKLDNT